MKQFLIDIKQTILNTCAIIFSIIIILGFIQVQGMREVLQKLAQEREVVFEQYPYKVYTKSRKEKYPHSIRILLKKAFNEGYVAAVYDKKNIETFKEFYDLHSRQYIIFDFFEREK